jgi:hypothetical protein
MLHTEHTKHMPAYAAVFCDSEQRMSQRYARVPFLLCKFRTCLQQPRSVVSALCPCALPSMYISHTWLRQQLQKALACCGLGLCSVITGSYNPRVLVQSKATLLQGVQAQALHGISRVTLHTCLLHTLCCCKLVLASMGTGFAQPYSTH